MEGGAIEGSKSTQPKVEKGNGKRKKQQGDEEVSNIRETTSTDQCSLMFEMVNRLMTSELDKFVVADEGLPEGWRGQSSLLAGAEIFTGTLTQVSNLLQDASF